MRYLYYHRVMSIAARLVPRSPKAIALASVFGLLFLLGSWQGMRAWWNHGYSKGQRTGIIRKFSYRGNPVCKYWLGELALSGSNWSNPEIWKFTTDSASEADLVIKDIQAAERGQRPVTLRYRQDRAKWWACAQGETEYYVVGVSTN